MEMTRRVVTNVSAVEGTLLSARVRGIYSGAIERLYLTYPRWDLRLR